MNLIHSRKTGDKKRKVLQYKREENPFLKLELNISTILQALLKLF
jgi:hypothetical protein